MGRRDDGTEYGPLEEEREIRRKEWAAWMWAVAEEFGIGERVGGLIDRSRRLLESKYPEQSVVCAFTALEVFGGEVVVAGLFGGLFQEFEGLQDLAAESIFGRNGRVQTLRRILRDAFGSRLLSADDWRDIERGQQIRNAIVHKGATASTQEAGKIVRAIARAIKRVMAACKSASDARVRRIIQAIEKGGSVLKLSPRGSEPS